MSRELLALGFGLNNPRIDPVPVVETQRQKHASDDAWESRLLSVRAVLLGTECEGLMPNLMFHNRGGTRFDDITTAGGFGHLQKDHGVSFADLDNDGDQDIPIELGAFPGDSFGNALFENPGFDNHWICIRLVGKRSNRSVIGARIRLDVEEQGQQRSVYKWVNSGGSFGANPLRQQIGVGKATVIHRLEVYWPTSQLTQQFEEIEVDQFIEIEEESNRVRKLAWKTLSFHPQEN